MRHGVLEDCIIQHMACLSKDLFSSLWTLTVFCTWWAIHCVNMFICMILHKETPLLCVPMIESFQIIFSFSQAPLFTICTYIWGTVALCCKKTFYLNIFWYRECFYIMNRLIQYIKYQCIWLHVNVQVDVRLTLVIQSIAATQGRKLGKML